MLDPAAEAQARFGIFTRSRGDRNYRFRVFHAHREAEVGIVQKRRFLIEVSAPSKAIARKRARARVEQVLQPGPLDRITLKTYMKSGQEELDESD